MTALRCIVCAAILLVASDVTTAAAHSQRAIPNGGDLRVYYCHNFSLVTLRVFPGRVEIEIESRKATLIEAPAPSPVQYTDGKVTLSSLEELVRIEEPGNVYFCRSAPAEIPWQDARLRGIDFRAAGENPMWSLEIDSGKGVEFAAGVGDARTVAKFPPSELAGKGGRMTLTTVSGARSLAVLVEKGSCSLAGSAMTLTVTVTLDGQTYRGCGRPLTPPLP